MDSTLVILEPSVVLSLNLIWSCLALIVICAFCGICIMAAYEQGKRHG